MAIEHDAIGAGELHEPKGVASASSGRVYIADGAGSGAWANVPSPYITEVVVKDEGDFPSAVLGVRLLAANTIYTLDGHIDIDTDTITLSTNTWIRGFDAAHSSLTHTGSGNLFTASNSFTLSGFAVNCASGTVFACTGTPPAGANGYESTYLKELTINSATSLGNFHDWYSFFWDKGAAVSFTDPLEFTGIGNILIMDLVSFIAGYTAAAVDLDAATFNTCSFFRCGFSAAAPTTHLIVSASGGNINTGKIGRINFCSFSDIATPVTGFTKADVQWESFKNLGLVSTAKAAQGYLHGIAASEPVTTLSSSTPAVINMDAEFVEVEADQFTVSTNGRFTYNGLTPSTFSITVAIAGTTDAGTNQNVNHWLYKNGSTQIVSSKTRREYNTAAVGSPAPVMALVELEATDYVELWVENDGASNGWESHIINIKITEVL